MMEILQVKKYHTEIASVKRQKALDRWRESDCIGGFPVATMFYFFVTDSKGYPTTLRKNGYVAFDDRGAAFGMTPEKARALKEG